MKSYGLDLQHTDANATADQIATGPVLPASPNTGAIFWLTALDNGHEPGSYFYDGTNWLLTGDITSVSAGQGLIGGGADGDISLSVDPNYTVIDTDLRLYDSQTLVVKQNPGKGQFGSVAAALDAITDNSYTKTYCIDVGAGVFFEPQLVCKPFVFIRGKGQGSTILFAQDPNSNFIIGCERGSVANVTIHGVTGTGTAAVYYNHPTGNTTLHFLVENIKFGNNYKHASCVSGNLMINNCTFGSVFQFTYGFIAESDGTYDCRVNVRDSTSSGMTSPYPAVMFAAYGPRSQVLINGVVARASSTLAGASDVGIGLHLNDGGHCRVLSTSLVGFSKGVWCENAGVGPYMSVVGMNLESNAQDLVVDHPGTTGSFTGVATRANSSVVDGANVTILYSDVTSPGTVGVGPMYLGPTHSLAVDVSPLITKAGPLGLLEGGVLTWDNSSFNIGISAGIGYLQDTNSNLVRVTWPTQILVGSMGTARYIYVDVNGAIQQSVTLPTFGKAVVLGRYVSSLSSTIFAGPTDTINLPGFLAGLDKYNKLAFGPVFISGCVVTENASTPLSLDVSAGHYFYSSEEWNPPAMQSVNFLQGVWLSGGQRGLVYTNTLDNVNYDTGSSLAPLTAGYYTKHTLYLAGSNATTSTYILGRGNGNFATLTDAVDAPLPPTLLPPDGSPLLAAIIVQQGNPNVVQIIDLRPRPSFKAGSSSGGVTIHGDLQGLNVDDHKQYLLVDGTRSMVGDLNLNSNSITNAASINGINISSHASRHLPNGADPLTTASAVGISASSTNQVGIANSFARSDHTHQITGFQKSSGLLDSISGLTPSNGVVKMDSNGTFSVDTSTYLTANQNITVTGDATGSGTTAIALTLANTGVAAGTYDSVTVDTKGRVVSGVVNPPLILQFLHGSIPETSGTTSISYGNSAPTTSQGTLLLSKVVTPVKATSSFLITFTGLTDTSTTNATVIVSVFRGTTFIGAGAITGSKFNSQAAPMSVQILDSPNTTSPVTYSIRIGISGGGTWYLGQTYYANFGGTNPSTWTIRELS